MSETTAGVLIVLITVAGFCFLSWLEDYREKKEDNDDKD